MKRIILSLLLLSLFASCEDDGGIDSGSLSGKGGSMARFAMSKDYLYVVDEAALNVYKIDASGGLDNVTRLPMDLVVETIFATSDYLYIGTNTAMVTYDISTPGSPQYVSSYEHVVACDPVVVQDTLAFVTIRTSTCRQNDNTNVLDIINIKDPKFPELITTRSMTSPYGLGVDGNLLFVCEGVNGLKIYDISNPFNPVEVGYRNVHALDVIADDGVLIVTGPDGISQFSYANAQALEPLSFIPIVQ